MRAKMRRPSGAWPIPSETILWAGRPSIRSPWNVIVPAVGRFRPEIVLRVVVLPAPLPPISVTISPSSTRSSIPLTASIPP